HSLRNYCYADCLHCALYRHGYRAHRARTLASTGGQRRAGSKCIEKTVGFAWRTFFALGASDSAFRRDDGNDLVHSRLSAWPGARLVLNVTRWIVAEVVQQRASSLPHTGFFHLGRRFCRGNSRGSARYRHRFRPLQHRNFVRFRAGFDRRADSALPRTQSPSRISLPRRPHCADFEHSFLPSPDDGTANSHLAALLRMADYRPGNLLLLQPPPQRIRAITLGKIGTRRPRRARRNEERTGREHKLIV